MARYRVAFDGHWQEEFDYEEDAMEWAEEVAEPTRVVYVVRAGRLRRHRLLAVFPTLSSAEGRRRWRWRRYGPLPGSGGS